MPSACRKLWLGDNQLQALPEGITRLSNLQQLYLEDNKLAQLPLELVHLPSLLKVYITGNPIQQLVAHSSAGTDSMTATRS